MATIRLREKKDGTQFYEIRASRKRGETPPTMRWEIPEGWSKRTIDRELNKAAAEFDRKYKSGELISKREMKERKRAAEEAEARIQTVKQYGELVYMPRKRVKCSDNTVLWYQYYLNKFIYPAIGNLKITQVTAAHIDNLVLKAQENGYAYKTVKGIYQTICQLVTMAYKSDLIDRNPADKTDSPERRKDERPHTINPFTLEEEQHLLKCLEKAPLQWRVYFTIMAETACRRGEVCAIKWRQVDFESNTITIDSSIVYVPGEEQKDTTTKTGQTRIVDITPATAALIKDLYQAQLKQGRLSPYLFHKKGSSEVISVQSPTAWFRKFGKQCGIENCHPHRFRHSWATMAIENGIPMATVSKVLGHSQISTTLDIYTHPDHAARKKASEAFHNILYGTHFQDAEDSVQTPPQKPPRAPKTTTENDIKQQVI